MQRTCIGWWTVLDSKNLDAVKRRVAQYVNEGIIRKSTKQNSAFFLTNAKNSLDCARLLYEVSTQEQMRQATHLVEFNGFLWVVNTSYYAMFYAARALMESQGRTIKSSQSIHAITFDALVQYGYLSGKLSEACIQDFEQAQDEATQLLGREQASKLIEEYEHEKEKRATLTYEIGEIAMQNKAKTSLERATRFVEVVRGMVSEEASGHRLNR